MAKMAQPFSEEHSCCVCGIKSDNGVPLHGEQQGEQMWVCIRCLPVLIHGGSGLRAIA